MPGRSVGSMIPLRRFSVVVVVSGLLVASCGSSSSKADPAADLAVAKAASLTAADLPGYSAKPHKESGDLPASAKKNFADCLGVSATFFDDTPGQQEANSP